MRACVLVAGAAVRTVPTRTAGAAARNDAQLVVPRNAYSAEERTADAALM
jgi:hypothetical protein